jgi:MoxR-like ATPase
MPESTTDQLTLTDADGADALPPGYPNATYAKPPALASDPIEAAFDYLEATATWVDGTPVRSGTTVAIEGHAGTGKTSGAKASAAARNRGLVYLSAPVLDITSLYCSFPERLSDEQHTRVHTILASYFSQDRPYYVVVDDFRRITPSAQGAFFELMNEGKLAGIKMRGLIGLVVVDNPMGENYLGVSGGDPAFETRFISLDVDATQTGWRGALAVKYADVDLKGLFEAWSAWDPTVRRTVSPRVLDHLIGVVLAGLPAEIALPIMPTGRIKVLDAGGVDVTAKVLDTVANKLGAIPANGDDVLERAFDAAFANGWNVHVVGPHGVGKTAWTEARMDAVGADMAYLSMAHVTPADLLVTVPSGPEGIEVIPNEKLLAGDDRKVLVMDEVFRSRPTVKGQMLELIQERSIGGIATGAHQVVALNNPAKWGEFTYPVGKADEALCSRFQVNLFVTEEDIPWKDWLRATYGEDLARPFLEWRAHSLNDTERAIMCPRVMEHMLQIHAHNVEAPSSHQLPLDAAIPKGADGRRIPIRLHDLNRRLAGLKVLGFSRIVAESDDVIAKLTSTGQSEVDEAARLSLEAEVSTALQNAELFELEEHRDLCGQLLMACSKSVRISVFRMAKESGDGSARQQFWAQVAKGLRDQAD